MTKTEIATEQLLIAQTQLLLAEQRTNYAMLRTGITIFTLAPSVVVFLIATNNFHHVFDNYWLTGVCIGILAGLSAMGVMLAKQANTKIRKVGDKMKKMKSSDQLLAEFMI